LDTILIGDAAARLRELPPASIDCIITSPPYFGLRDYGQAGQLGLEPHVSAWVARLRLVFAAAALAWIAAELSPPASRKSEAAARRQGRLAATWPAGADRPTSSHAAGRVRWLAWRSRWW
jgi:hypothetical protein